MRFSECPGGVPTRYPVVMSRALSPPKEKAGPSFSDPRHRFGIRGEMAALAYLVRRGWSLEAHRFRFGRHDVDLVVRRGELVAFVEVKSRSTRTHGSGLEAVGWQKRRTLALGAAWWRQRFGRPGDQYRFDVVAIECTGPTARIEHVEDAWRMDT